MATAYPFMSGQLLHLRDCPNLGAEQPQLATPEALKALPVCETCAWTVRSGARSTTVVTRAESFTCPRCTLAKPIAFRNTEGICRDCD